ncbi:hypothetical protein LCGC14_0539000 [marine sediment metagenome]|uniref:Uncharacterized protein n=1 Tax=marine sediment metagenome TaxID=412755 RepID=A0A0F9RTF2_9ZZZZ
MTGISTVNINNKKSKQWLYDAVGGQDGIIIVVNLFYDFVESTPEGRPVAKLHLRGHGIAHARIELVNFLSGFLGGPSLFEARDSWMACMEMAMTQLDYDDELKQRLTENFLVIATLLINH